MIDVTVPNPSHNDLAAALLLLLSVFLRKTIRPSIEHVIAELREAYEKHQADAHYTAKIEDRTVVVTPSDELEHEVHDIIDRVTH